MVKNKLIYYGRKLGEMNDDWLLKKVVWCLVQAAEALDGGRNMKNYLVER